MIHPSLPLLATTLILAASVASQDASGDRIRLGTWNLEHFGHRKPARTAKQIETTGAFIRSMAVDVLAVQEIDSDKALRRLCRAIGPDWRFVLGRTGGFRDDPGRIAVGFAWNDSRVELLSAEDCVQLPSKVPHSEFGELPIFHRKPVSAAFRARQGGRVDFRAITVHLKASRGGKNEAKRSAEVTELRRYIDSLLASSSEDRDIIVLGDFNHTYGAPPCRVFEDSDAVDYLRAASEGAPPRTIVHFEDPIDHIACTPGVRDDLRQPHLTVHGDVAAQDLKAWRANYSDHIPVTVDLQNSVDRDPDATFLRPPAARGIPIDGIVTGTATKGPSAAALSSSPRGLQDHDGLPKRLRRGDSVEIILNTPATSRSSSIRAGTLVAEPDDWVQIWTEETPPRLLALPRSTVRSIQRR